jgi:exosome complex RNA-binding protein Rrp42 (RNase PH superfamily)
LTLLYLHCLQVLQLDGNPVDMCSVAACVALGCTTIPATEPIPGESGQLEDFNVSGDVSDGSPVDVSAFPLAVTLAKVTLNNIFRS